MGTADLLDVYHAMVQRNAAPQGALPMQRVRESDLMAWWEKIEPKGRVQVSVDELTFDYDNPRFTPEKRPTEDTEAAVIAHLAASADLAELVQSISASGYVDIEPLIVIGRGEQLVVLEGNRRLAALKVLRDENLASQARINIPPLTLEKAFTFNRISVYRVTSEDDARDLIGFKHINGPQAWDAYAKARYAAHWLDVERARREAGESGLTVAEIAHRMGDKHDTIYRIVSAAYVLEQAERDGLFQVEDRARKNFSFSHLYTALTYPEYRDFIGMGSADRSKDPMRNPVPNHREADLRQLLIWLYGSKAENVEPAIKKQNPDLARLKRVLGDPRSRRVMMERQNLDEAIDSTVTPTERFEKSLVDSEQSLKSAQSSIDGYNGADETLMQIAHSVLDKARTIARVMEGVRRDYLSGGAESDE